MSALPNLERPQLIDSAEELCCCEAMWNRARSAIITAALMAASALLAIAGYLLAFVSLVLGFTYFAGLQEAWIGAAAGFVLLFSLAKASAWCWESARYRAARS